MDKNKFLEYALNNYWGTRVQYDILGWSYTHDDWTHNVVISQDFALRLVATLERMKALPRFIPLP